MYKLLIGTKIMIIKVINVTNVLLIRIISFTMYISLLFYCPSIGHLVAFDIILLNLYFLKIVGNEGFFMSLWQLLCFDSEPCVIELSIVYCAETTVSSHWNCFFAPLKPLFQCGEIKVSLC